MLTTILLLATLCNPDLQHHVYHPQRLKVIKECVTVSGTIVKRVHEADGDWHIQLRLDTPKFNVDEWINDRNRVKQGGNLVVEVICQGDVKQRDAVAACKGVTPVDVPKVGSHVEVTGPYIQDVEQNHGWREIHPAQVKRIH